MKTALLSHPYIRTVALQRRLPAMLVITVEERVPLAVLDYLGTYIVIDEDNHILETREEMVYPACPLVSGVFVTTFSAGQTVQLEDEYSLEILDQLLLAMRDEDMLSLISEIDMSNMDNIRMISRTGVILRLGQAWQMEEKVRWIQPVLADLQSRGLVGGQVDVSTGHNAIYQSSSLGAVIAPEATATPTPPPDGGEDAPGEGTPGEGTPGEDAPGEDTPGEDTPEDGEGGATASPTPTPTPTPAPEG